MREIYLMRKNSGKVMGPLHVEAAEGKRSVGFEVISLVLGNGALKLEADIGLHDAYALMCEMAETINAVGVFQVSVTCNAQAQ